MSPRLDPAERDAALARLAGWSLSADGRSIEKRFSFADFGEAFAFMTRVAQAAETLDHHPDWSNRYGVVEISLSTHSEGGVTALDLALATRIEAIATA